MFSNIVDALQGPAVEATDEVPGGATAVPDQKAGSAHGDGAPGSSKQQPDPVAAQGRHFNLWGMASALADTVKKTTADLSASVAETDWRAELEAFGKGVADDANEVQRHTQAAVREGATRLENLPQQAAKARFPPVDSTAVKTHIDQVGNRLGRLGTNLLAGSKELFEQVAEAVQNELDGIEGHISKPRKSTTQSRASRQAQKDAPKYSRLEAEISAMQRNSSTYCDQPEDAEDFARWLETCDLGSKQEEIRVITKENAFMAELQSRIVPLIVQYEVFWTRYFYQLDKLKQKHAQRQNVVQRAAAQSPREQVSWDDEEEGADEHASDAGSPAEMAKGRVGRDTSPPAPTSATEAPPPPPAEQVPAVAAAPKAPAPVKAVAAHADEEPDTSTASDDSGNGPWTVVSSPPQHQRTDSVEDISRPSPVPEEGPLAADDAAAHGTSPKAQAAPKGTAAKPEPADDNEELDIDISDDDAAAPGADGEGSEVEEDWGLWD